MAITTIRIHPAIGIARVGDSPDEFFIGPERPLDKTPPPGGYKDAQCRIKRQGARFRLFSYDENDVLIGEVNVPAADITWTVHLANRKAASLAYSSLPTVALRNHTVTGADRDKLVIDPGARSITGAGGRQTFDTGTFTLPGSAPVVVPLGEIRTDTQGRLIVLGGHGKSGSPTNTPIDSILPNNTFNHDKWYDDVSDGPVTATVTIGGQPFDAEPAWVIVAPPKYAPPLDHVVTLHDRLEQYFIDNTLLLPFSDPSPSYTKYVYPILNRARQIVWVQSAPGVHQWPDPVIDDFTRNKVFGKLRKSDGTGGDMPLLRQEPALVPVTGNYIAVTDTQYHIMSLWQQNSYTNDWSGEPGPDSAITPQGLDVAALENCVGATFYPGIEAGHYLVSDPAIWARAFRLNTKAVMGKKIVNPGDVTARMALPWQTDFFACQTSWWPPARPNDVTPEGGGITQAWDAGVPDGAAFVNQWSQLGFVVRSGSQYLLTEECTVPFVHSLTPQLDFKNLPRGPMGMSRKASLAIEFEVSSTGAAVQLAFGPPPANPRLSRENPLSVSVGPTAPGAVARARLWVTYETGAPGEFVSDSVTVTQTGTAQQWTIPITASTVERKTALAALVLDRSGSMLEDIGDGQPRIKGLRDAANVFVDVMLEGDAVSLVRFNQAAEQLEPATALDPPVPGDLGRKTIKDAIKTQLDPAGQTSIGDGILKGRATITAAGGSYDVKSLLVFTDGKENHAPSIADEAAKLDATTYAVGLGTPQNISAAALQTISGNSGGYFLMTGSVTPDNTFLLQKYFLQILAGISNAEVMLDPTGELGFGESREIPFPVSEIDAGMDVILLSPNVGRIRFRLRSPIGEILDPARAASTSGALFVQSEGVSYYRIRLPLELFQGRPDSAGGWTALLDFGDRSTAAVSPQSLPADCDEPAPGGGPVVTLVRAIESGVSALTGRRGAPAGAPAAEETRATAGGPGPRIPYSLLVHTYSDLRLDARVHQDGLEPGARVRLSAALSIFGAPFNAPAHVWADVKRPDGTTVHVDYTSTAANEYEASFTTGVAGVYAIRVQAATTSPRGYRVRREKTLTALCRMGSDPAGAQPKPSDALCTMLRCGLERAFTVDARKRFQAQGLDVAALLQCACGEGKRVGDEYPDE